MDLYCQSGTNDSENEADLEGIQHLISLCDLHIFGWSKPSLTHQLQNLTNLRGLWIVQFDGLEDLPEWLGNFSSLEVLCISKCKNLRRLPFKEAFPKLTSLNRLYVFRCPLLDKGYADKEGEEFQKISHINTMQCWLGWKTRLEMVAPT
ncbi:probable disease resistance protein At5g66910 [Papaver somniferum]|uniref:probable disease resistance protein At5g66910 n=1 Tax=Papaver somniferum TaxID=3469 RepID=UPI000E6F9CCE|nr:probable disease resistance protein At5g66910 [Papaver somniferum]